MNIKYANLPEGLHKCRSSWYSYPWIHNVDNLNMTEDELIIWLNDEVPYILEVYSNEVYEQHSNGD